MLRTSVAATLVALAVAGCGGPDATAPDPPAAPQEAAFPADLTAYVDQSRVERVGRSVFVRLVHDGEGTVTVLRAEIASERFGEVEWTGEKTFQNEADLDFELPVGACGTGSDADVRLTYRLDDGPELVSETLATDRYGAIALFLERDCAEQTLGEAASIETGPHRVVGEGRDSVFELPVRFVPTGARDDVEFAGFEGTVLFSTAPGTPVHPEVAPVPLTSQPTGEPTEVLLRLVPGRCDPHALAEDKVGTLVYVYVDAPGLADGSSFYLPLEDETRADLRGFFGTHCGLT